MLDSRIIDLSLNKVFVKLILGEDVPLTMENLRVCVLPLFSRPALLILRSQRVDPGLAESLIKLRNMATTKGQSDKVMFKSY